MFLQEDIAAIFKAADKDNTGLLTIKEFKDVIDDILERYPQIEHYLKSMHLSDVTDLLKDSQGNDRDEVDIEGFKLALSHVDSQTKNLPATAQVFVFDIQVGLGFHLGLLIPLSIGSVETTRSHCFIFRLRHNKVHIFLNASTAGISVKIILKARGVSKGLVVINSIHFSMCS